MKLSKMLYKMKGHMAIQPEMFTHPCMHHVYAMPQRRGTGYLDNMKWMGRIITVMIKKDADIKHYACNKNGALIQINIPPSKDNERALNMWVYIEPKSSLFRKSTEFKWIRVSTPYNIYEANKWDKSSMPRRIVREKNVLYTGKLLSLGYPSVVSDSVHGRTSTLIRSTVSQGKNEFRYRLKPAVMEYRYSIIRQCNKRLKVEMGTMAFNVSVNDFLLAIEEEKAGRTSITPIIIYRSKSTDKYEFVRVAYLDIPDDNTLGLLQKQYVEDLLLNKDKEKQCDLPF